MIGDLLLTVLRFISDIRPEWIIAFATLAYAGFTGWIILEMRKDRKLLHRPILRAILKGSYYPEWLLFTIKNIGKGPALNCVASYKDSEETKWQLNGDIPPIGSNDSVDIKFELAYAHKNHSLGEETWLEIEYSDIFQKTYKDRIFEKSRITMLTEHRFSH